MYCIQTESAIAMIQLTSSQQSEKGRSLPAQTHKCIVFTKKLLLALYFWGWKQ
ncbi:hypothetical protein COO91_06806 [Nostoc flagelliforme CCNUN1]|uniref:Uncharacterized protein n=1 Tax=Nostoc flagelliforme CCNUN1 TaxID=2038116 RepID=A0A2K8SZB7_9NOSO|nr:hypothetical protein [Nostoc flagelliforme]AUB40781.1 hypothetical protein COO91_06806 [Nostoc flagelliforme CCNUN1]